MRKFCSIALLASITSFTPAFALTEAECSAQFMKADANKDSMLSEAEAGQVHASARVKNVAVKDGMISKADFMSNCQKGVYEQAKLDPGAPLKGANSFTEKQAIDWALTSGLTDVSVLAKDNDGIWRGTAKRDGKTVNVAVDFRGNVVSN